MHPAILVIQYNTWTTNSFTYTFSASLARHLGALQVIFTCLWV